MDEKEIYLAGGCFWGMQAYFEKIRGVLSSEVGYINGSAEATTYKEVCNDSGHAEVIKITYDSNVLPNKDVFKAFLRVIDPFSINKQGEDKGIQYRTGIYSNDAYQLESFVSLLTNWENNNKKSTIEIGEVKSYCKAEDDHQNYLDKNLTGYCHINLYDIPEEFKK